MESGNRPFEIKASHLARKAIVYVRQSSKKQVLENIGSAEYQRGLVRHLLEWGWHLDQTEIVEDDLARSGKTTRRPGYRRIITEITSGQAGIITVSFVERGGREAIGWFLLFNMCKDHDVLLDIDGRVHDLRDRNDRVMLRLAAVLAENDNEMRTENFLKGRIAKARLGAVVSPIPTGYIRQRNGSLTIDPTPGVVPAIRHVFAQYLRLGSIGKVIVSLRRQGIQVPGRRIGEEVKWADATDSNVGRILRNPTYTGAYHYGRTKTDPVLGEMECGVTRFRRTPLYEQIIHNSHHEPLVAPSEFVEVQRLLKRNAARWGRPSMSSKEGPLQTILFCAVHGYHLQVLYGPRRGDVPLPISWTVGQPYLSQ